MSDIDSHLESQYEDRHYADPDTYYYEYFETDDEEDPEDDE